MATRRGHEVIGYWLAALPVVLSIACKQEPAPKKFDPLAQGLDPSARGDASATLGPCDVPEGESSRKVSVSINEVFAGTLVDDRADWIELYNAGSQAVALDGWVIEDHYTGDVPKLPPGHFEFPSGTTLCAHDFLVVLHVDGCAGDPSAFAFGVGSTDRLVLMDSSGAVMDEMEWLDLPHEQSLGRINDDPRTLGRLAAPTAGFSNAEACECCGECTVGRCTSREGKCVALIDSDCSTSLACLQLGWCQLVGGACVAAAPEHCQASLLCARSGKCGLLDGACTVVADADCRMAKTCENEGRCTADLERAICIATSHADCERSHDCLHLDDRTSEVVSRKNRCTLDGERCVATSCSDTTVCRDKGCCSLVDGKCASPASP